MTIEYKVTWEIEVEADSPDEAARMCRKIQLDPRNIASVFMVEDTDTGVVSQIETDPEMKKLDDEQG